MSIRHVFPELFNATAQIIVAGQKSLTGLRWLLNPAIGLPRNNFQVWKFQGTTTMKPATLRTESAGGGMILLYWLEGPAAGVQINVDIPAGSVTFNSYSAARATGHLLERREVTGPLTNATITMTGSPVSSIKISAGAVIHSIAILPIDQFVNDPGWKLVETVGLPVRTPEFNSGLYPMTPQGPVGFETDPVKAAIRRVRNGTPDAGWPLATDRGVVVSPFIAPNPDVLVNREILPLMTALAQLLKEVADPSQQADHEVKVETTVPRSLNGMPTAHEWDTKVKPSLVKPLQSLVLTAGVDPFASLALGFGTTLVEPSRQVLMAAANRTGIFMITVKHKVTVMLQLFPLLDPIPFTVDGELAALCFLQKPVAQVLPTGFLVNSGTTPKVNPPVTMDGPWQESISLAWTRPVAAVAGSTNPTGYAIACQLPGKPLDLKIQKRLSGGWLSFIPALSGNTNLPATVRFTDQDMLEPLPAELPGVVYSIAAQDWFGRWSGWISTDYTRVTVAPQIPAALNAALTLENIASPTKATVSVEFSWNWSSRRPAMIVVRILLHDDGTAAPILDGSVLAVGAPRTNDLIINFMAATITTPPAGIELITEESSDTVKKYRINIGAVSIPGKTVFPAALSLNLHAHSKTKFTIRMKGTERYAPVRASLWSKDVFATAINPTPPPAPFIPSPMVWASIPDPKGISTITLSWNAITTATAYAVYEADETAILRELNLPSANLEIPMADRLVLLRSFNITQARRAFRRIVTNISSPSFKISLPKNSKIIHFYGVIPISSTGVEGKLPILANQYFAVAAPVVRIPEVPVLIARDKQGAIRLSITLTEIKAATGTLEVFRSPRQYLAADVETMGPPVMIVTPAMGQRSGNTISWQIPDAFANPPWQSVFYRAVAVGVTDLLKGEYAGRSLASPAAEVVPSSAVPSTVSDIKLDTDAMGTPLQLKLLNFLTNTPLDRTPIGVHTFGLKLYETDLTFSSRSITADKLPLIGGSLPTPAEQTNTIFRFDPLTPRNGRIYAWVPETLSSLVIEITDPLGKVTRFNKDFV